MVQKGRFFEPDRQFSRGVQIDLQRGPAEAGPGKRIVWRPAVVPEGRVARAGLQAGRRHAAAFLGGDAGL